MKVLIACEESGIVRDAFLALGHYAMSCDLMPTRSEGPHYHGDVRDILDDNWDLMIGHPPCTDLSLSGARWCTDHWVKRKNGDRWHDGAEKRAARDKGLEFFKLLWDSKIPRICLEQPMSVASRVAGKRHQEIQPWQFGHGEMKTTWLWLKNLPPLVATNIVEGREQKVWKMRPGENRARERSVTYQGIAEAMAKQWGELK